MQLCSYFSSFDNQRLIMFRLFFVVINSLIISAKGLLVTVDQGTLNGTYVEARDGNLFNAFYGIPFAKPPIGELRLKSPVAAGSWNGVLDATQIPLGCLEWDSDKNTTKGGEDCLNLNVYTPLNARRGDKLAVLFYIYGGIFMINNNVDFGPQYMMSRNLIIVIPNYRSGPLGFLSTGDATIAGNFGLKDQLLALKWTRRNIHHFGGDPNQITINGHSSGATCAHLHTISPASKGLFQQVILQSGSASCSLSYWGPDVSRAVAVEFGTRAGCPSVASSRDMYECFMNLSADLFATLPEQMHIWNGYPDAPFRPTVESTLVEDAFLTDIPLHLEYHSPHQPWMIGLTTGESCGTLSQLLANGGAKAKILNKFYKTLLPIMLEYLWHTEYKDLNYVSQLLKTHYFGDKDIGPKTADKIVQLFTHGNFGFCVLDAVHSYPGPKYVYWYDYVASYPTQKSAAIIERIFGPGHSEEVNLLFQTEKSVDVLDDRDIMVSKEMVKRWVNFVQSSNPNFPVEINATMMDYWMLASSPRIEYLLIDINGRMGTDLYKDVYPFWKSLPIGNKYYSYEPNSLQNLCFNGKNGLQKC